MAGTAATCIAVGKTSLDDWPLFTSSLGWTRRSSPRGPPRISLARFARTSFMFMLVCVPLPVCHTASGNSPSCLPVMTSSAASMMALAFFGSNNFSSRLTCAAARFTWASALISCGGIFSVPILKFISDRCVCAPHSRSAGTSMGPKVSFSMRVAMRSLLSTKLSYIGEPATTTVFGSSTGASALLAAPSVHRERQPRGELVIFILDQGEDARLGGAGGIEVAGEGDEVARDSQNISHFHPACRQAVPEHLP